MSKEIYSDNDGVTVLQADEKISIVSEKYLNKIIENEGFLTYDIKVNEIKTNGENYLGNLQQIDIKGTTVDGDKEIHLFVKNRELNSNFTLIAVDEAYRREAYYYSELTKIYERMQNKANVPLNERLNMAKGYEQSNGDVTIMENLSRNGFSTCSRLEFMSIEFAESSIKQIARFHGLSLVLKVKEPDYYEKKIKVMTPLIKINSDWRSFFTDIYNSALSQINGRARETLENNRDKIKYIMENYNNNIASSKGYCLCHGDFKINNIMTNKKNGAIDKAMIMDFQLMHCGVPITDLHYFIGSGTDQEFRKKHLENLKNLYHNTLGTFLDYFDVKVEDVYSRHQFEAEYAEFKPYCVTVFVMMAPFLFFADDVVPDLAKPLEAIKMKWNDQTKKMLVGVIEDFLE